jgi:hypothetical protein
LVSRRFAGSIPACGPSLPLWRSWSARLFEKQEVQDRSLTTAPQQAFASQQRVGLPKRCAPVRSQGARESPRAVAQRQSAGLPGRRLRGQYPPARPSWCLWCSGSTPLCESGSTGSCPVRHPMCAGASSRVRSARQAVQPRPARLHRVRLAVGRLALNETGVVRVHDPVPARRGSASGSRPRGGTFVNTSWCHFSQNRLAEGRGCNPRAERSIRSWESTRKVSPMAGDVACWRAFPPRSSA